MADSFFTLSSSVLLKINQKIKPIVSNRLYRFNNKKTWNDVFDEVADPDEMDMRKTDKVVVTVSDKSGLQTFEPDMSESIEVVQEFDNKLKFATFTVKRYHSETDEEENNNVNKEKGKSYLDVLMSNARHLTCTKNPIRINEENPRFTAKDALFNKVCGMFEECQAKFPTTFLNDEVKRYTMILADALWYLNGHFGCVQEKASHIPDIVAIPERFLDFEGFNDYKRKKQKCPNLQSNVLNGHAKTLSQLASKQFCVNWKDLHDDIKNLATTFSSYSTFLDNSNKQQKERQNKFTPSRQIEKDIWLDKRQAAKNEINLEYQGLDNRIKETEHFTPIFFDEELFLTNPFDSSMDRFRFFWQSVDMILDVQIPQLHTFGNYQQISLMLSC